MDALQDLNRDGISLVGVDISGAFLPELNLENAKLERANISGADLRNANLHDIKNWQTIQSIEFANIYKVVNPPEGFIEWAKENGAVSIESKQEWIQTLSQKRQEKAKEQWK